MNHSRDFFNRLTGYTPVLLAIAVLPGCCFLPIGVESLGKGSPTQKPCNCYAKNADRANVANGTNRADGAGQGTQESKIKDGTVTAFYVPAIDQPADHGQAQPVTAGVNGLYAEDEIDNDLQSEALKKEDENLPAAANYDLSFNDEKKLPLGIKGIESWIIAGPNLSFKKHDEEDLTNYKRKAGVAFHAGFGSTYYFTDKFAFSPSVHFKQMKAGGKSTVTGETAFTETYSYNYLSVPLLAQFNLADGLSAFAGPEVNYLLSGKSKTTYASETHKESLNKSSVKLGIGIQAGIKYSIPDTRFGIQLVYDHRISRVNKKSGGDDYGGGYTVPAIRMRGFQLGLVCSVCNKKAGK